MKRILGITAAALMGASVLAAPAAFAQADQNFQNEPEAGFDTNLDTQLDTGTTAAIGSSFDGALAAIGNNAANAASIGAMSDIGSVNVVRIGEIEGSDPALVEQAVSQNADGVEALRASIEANPPLNQALQTEGISAASVVAADLDAAGGVTIYVM